MIETESRSWPDRMNTREACEYLNVSRQTLYQWGRIHRIKRFKRKGVVRWPRAELDRILRAGEEVMR